MREGMIVTALVDSEPCGQGVTQKQGSEVVYVVKVAADANQPGCGAAGRTVRFQVEDRVLPAQVGWDNTRATKVPLAADANVGVYLQSTGL